MVFFVRYEQHNNKKSIDFSSSKPHLYSTSILHFILFEFFPQFVEIPENPRWFDETMQIKIKKNFCFISVLLKFINY